MFWIHLRLEVPLFHYNGAKHYLNYQYYIKIVMNQLFVLINMKMEFCTFSNMKNVPNRMFLECF